MNWESSAFCNVEGNLNFDAVPDFVNGLWLQVAWGTSATPCDPAWVTEARQRGYRLYAWAWCQGEDVEGEAQVHAQAAEGYDAFCANMEEPYDAHGDSGHPRYGMPARYLAALDWIEPLALTTTARFGSDMSAWIAAGAVVMPQAFSQEQPSATLTACVEHMQAWGWPLAQIRPLTQSYEPRPDPVTTNLEAAGIGIGVIPYVLEQATDPDGIGWLTVMRDAIVRPQPATPEPEPPEPEDDMELIGSQHGIKAAYERMKLLDPDGCTPAFDPDDYNAIPASQLKAWSKECRAKLILAADHDEWVKIARETPKAQP